MFVYIEERRFYSVLKLVFESIVLTLAVEDGLWNWILHISKVPNLVTSFF